MSDLSVIVPVYNAEQYLRQCVDSIVNQTLKDIEIILVDDGSTDNSGQICDEYAEQFSNIYVEHQKNTGPYGARMTGMLHCNTKYVTFVDADDFIEPIAYSRAVASMNNDIDIIMFDIYNYSEKLGIKKKNKTVFPYGVYNRNEIRNVIYPKLIWNGSVSNALQPHLVTKIFKYDLINKALHSYDRLLQYYGDDNITTATAVKYAETIEFIDHTYYNYRARDIGEIPPYIASDKFFDEVYSMYHHLRNLFSGEDTVLKQIDMFYIEAVNCKRKYYGLPAFSAIKYMFPFDKIKINKSIVLYGAGEVGKAYRAQLNMINYCKDILWVDKNYEKYHNSDIVSVDNVLNYPFDYVVVAVANKEVADNICDDLLSMGIPKEKIII